MVESFQALFKRLSELSSTELDSSAEKLVRAEKRNAALLIAHIAEVSERKLALERGYKNTFDYCVKRLNLSEGAVALRLHVANVSKRIPQLLAAIAENRVSLRACATTSSQSSRPDLVQIRFDRLSETRGIADYFEDFAIENGTKMG